MGKSPGHQKWPDHKIREERLDHRIQVAIDGEIVADSRGVIKLEEDHHPVRYYFPRSDVRMERMERSETTTECPFKGTAHYFSLNVADRKLQDAVWTYADPYEEQDLKGRLAFYDEKIKGIDIRPAR